MSKSSNKALALAKTNRDAVFTAAINEGKSVTEVVSAIVAAIKGKWDDVDLVDSIAGAYKAARLVVSLKLETESSALAILALKPHKDGDDDGRRTLGQQLATRAAISAWSNVRNRAGAPSAQTGAKRKPRATTSESSDEESELPDNLLPAITRATSEQDVHAYALRVAQNMTRYMNHNAKLVHGDIGEAMRGFIASVSQVAIEDKLAA